MNWSNVAMRHRPARTLVLTVGLLIGCPRLLVTQTRRNVPPAPLPLRLAPSANGELTATAPFAMESSVQDDPKIAIEPKMRSLRITCSWEPNIPLQVSVTAAAGHGLPGQIGMESRTGGSPLTIEVQIPPEQMVRGPIYVELHRLSGQSHGRVSLRGTMVVSTAGGSIAAVGDGESVQDALEEGKLLSAAEVKALEHKLKTNPHDWSARLSLLAYYSSSAGLRLSKAQIIDARRKLILWVIEHRPTAPEIFELPDLQLSSRGPLADLQGLKEAEAAWLRAIAGQRENVQVLINAASFCGADDPKFIEKTLLQAKSSSRDGDYLSALLGWFYGMAMAPDGDSSFAKHAYTVLLASTDPALLAAAATQLALQQEIFASKSNGTEHPFQIKYVELAEHLAAQAVSLEPQNPYLLLPLLQVLVLEVQAAPTPQKKLPAEEKVYKMFRHLDDVAIDPADRIVLLPELANLALDIGDDHSATTYALQTLDLESRRKDRNLGRTVDDSSAIHDANDVLGRIALKGGQVPEAKAYLLKAAAIPVDSDTSTFEPEMELAQALLDLGERDVVMQYLNRLRTSWKNGNVLLDLWIEAIQLGESVRLNHSDVPLRHPLKLKTQKPYP